MKNILILCPGNSCRSQMAEGYLQFFAGDKAKVYSAGVDAKGVNPKAIEVMREDNIDISGQCSNSMEEFSDILFHYIITVCDEAQHTAGEFYTKITKFHQHFPDPTIAAGTEDDVLEQFRKVQSLIRYYCAKFAETYL